MVSQNIRKEYEWKQRLRKARKYQNKTDIWPECAIYPTWINFATDSMLSVACLINIEWGLSSVALPTETM